MGMHVLWAFFVCLFCLYGIGISIRMGSCPIPPSPICCHKIVQAALYKKGAAKKGPVLIGRVWQGTLSTVKMRSKAQKTMLGFHRTAQGRHLQSTPGLQRDTCLV